MPITEPLLPRGFSRWVLWQFTSDGAIDGVKGRCDVNRTPPFVSTKQFTLRPPIDPPMRITQVYGARPEYYAQFGLDGHEGLDMGGKDGDPIYAAADGIVKLLAPDNGIHPYGAHLRITHNWHNDSYETIYAHLRGFRAGLTLGQNVHAGDVIGYMGSSGNSTGVHVHMTLKKNGKIIDPTPYLK